MTKETKNKDLPKEVKDYLDKMKTNIEEYAEKLEASKSFELDPHLVSLMWDEPFYSAISRQITKRRSTDLPTMGVTVQGTEPILLWNPIFTNELDANHVRGVLIHEFMHLVYDHVTLRRREPHNLWNIATDAAINSMIPRKNLPENLVLPGELNKKADPNDPIWKLISTWPIGKSSDWYMSSLLNDDDVQEMMEQQSQCPVHGDKDESDQGDSGNDEGQDQGDSQSGNSNGDGGQPGDSDGGHSHGGGDKKCSCPQYGHGDHSGWDDLNDQQREMVQGKVREILRSAVKEADSRNGWGSCPSGMREELRSMVSNKVDWKSLLRQTLGMAMSSLKTTTRKKRNRKYKFIHPGTKRHRQARVCIAIDQSGSVGNDDLELFFGELNNLAKNVEFDVVPFDYTCDEENIVNWKRGQRKPPQRTRGGGTNFQAPTDYVNANKDQYDMLIILTDGEAPAPNPCLTKRAWVICPGRELMFETTESVITMDRKKDESNVA